jgi:Secretion system C-terminal sorting domain/BNR/Asp-box repeat
MKKLFFLLLILPLYVVGQHQNVKISSQNTPNEPSIFINPQNTNEIVCGYNTDNSFYSTDGGQTWTYSGLTSTLGVWGDPCIISDHLGNFYFFHLSNPLEGNWIDRIVCQKSEDVGATWNDGSYAGLNGTKAQDKEWAVFDYSTKNIYMTWTQFDRYGSGSILDSSLILFSKSTDLGESWSEPKILSEKHGDCIDDDNTVEGAVPAVGPNGEIFVSWSGPEGIVFDRSLDQGETWLENDIFVNAHAGGWAQDIPGISRCNGMPVTICDTSGGTYNGTIYINYADTKNGNDDTDIWLVKSNDNGNSWSIPKRVNNDGPGKHQFFPWMAVDQVTGYIYIVFYDRRNYEDTQTDVYLAVSKNGGEHFENYKISESPFTPDPNVFFGDYNNISAYNNVVRPIWTRFGTDYPQDNGLSVWTALIDLEATDIHQVAKKPEALEQNYPNPFSAQTFISFKIKKPERISLSIHDIFGKEVCKVIQDSYYQPGKYVESFDAEKHKISPGVYYFILTMGETNQTKKMVIE